MFLAGLKPDIKTLTPLGTIKTLLQTLAKD
jgi:hypothetical protein